MFYEYLKTVYNVIDNYHPKNPELNLFIKANRSFIDSLNSKNYIHSGGNYEESFNKTLENFSTTMQNLIQKLKAKPKEQLTHLDFEYALQVIKFLVDYIVVLNRLVQDKNLDELQNQLTEITTILSKYAN